MKKKLAAISFALLSSVSFAGAFAADAETKDYSEYLSGNWGGARTSLEDAGISTEVVYKFDVMNNVSGGIKEGTRALDNLDVIFGFDGEKIVGVKGLSAKIQLLNNFGGTPDADLVGSGQGIDNIEVPQSTGKLYQAVIEQNLFEDKISLLAGLYDLNSEFYLTDSSALFIHSTFGIGTDIAQSGQNGPSIFPFTSLAGRVRVKPTEDTYVQFAVLDAVPGDVDHLNGTHINLDENDGELWVAEAGYTPSGAKLAVGKWYYSEKFDHQTLVDSNGDPLKKHSQGAYIIGEKQVYHEQGDQGLTLFGRLGFANGSVNQFDYAWSAGMVYTGLFPSRDEGQLGFAMTGAHNGNEFKDASFAAGTPVDSAETTFELTYSDKITPWLAVQPDVQYLVNPGTDKTIDNALILGTRLTVNF